MLRGSEPLFLDAIFCTVCLWNHKQKKIFVGDCFHEASRWLVLLGFFVEKVQDHISIKFC